MELSLVIFLLKHICCFISAYWSHRIKLSNYRTMRPHVHVHWAEFSSLEYAYERKTVLLRVLSEHVQRDRIKCRLYMNIISQWEFLTVGTELKVRYLHSWDFEHMEHCFSRAVCGYFTLSYIHCICIWEINSLIFLWVRPGVVFSLFPPGPLVNSFSSTSLLASACPQGLGVVP